MRGGDEDERGERDPRNGVEEAPLGGVHDVIRRRPLLVQSPSPSGEGLGWGFRDGAGVAALPAATRQQAAKSRGPSPDGGGDGLFSLTRDGQRAVRPFATNRGQRP